MRSRRTVVCHLSSGSSDNDNHSPNSKKDQGTVRENKTKKKNDNNDDHNNGLSQLSFPSDSQQDKEEGEEGLSLLSATANAATNRQTKEEQQPAQGATKNQAHGKRGKFRKIDIGSAIGQPNASVQRRPSSVATANFSSSPASATTEQGRRGRRGGSVDGRTRIHQGASIHSRTVAKAAAATTTTNTTATTTAPVQPEKLWNRDTIDSMDLQSDATKASKEGAPKTAAGKPDRLVDSHDGNHRHCVQPTDSDFEPIVENGTETSSKKKKKQKSSKKRKSCQEDIEDDACFADTDEEEAGGEDARRQKKWRRLSKTPKKKSATTGSPSANVAQSAKPSPTRNAGGVESKKGEFAQKPSAKQSGAVDSDKENKKDGFAAAWPSLTKAKEKKAASNKKEGFAATWSNLTKQEEEKKKQAATPQSAVVPASNKPKRKKFQKDILKVGDRISYYHPLYVAGNPQGYRETIILAVEPLPLEEDSQVEYYPLELDNAEVLPSDTRVKRLVTGRERPIDEFVLIQGKSGDKTGLQRKAERLGEIFKAARQELAVVPEHLQRLDQFRDNDDSSESGLSSVSSADDESRGKRKKGKSNAKKSHNNKKKEKDDNDSLSLSSSEDEKSLGGKLKTQKSAARAKQQTADTSRTSTLKKARDNEDFSLSSSDSRPSKSNFKPKTQKSIARARESVNTTPKLLPESRHEQQSRTTVAPSPDILQQLDENNVGTNGAVDVDEEDNVPIGNDDDESSIEAATVVPTPHSSTRKQKSSPLTSSTTLDSSATKQRTMRTSSPPSVLESGTHLRNDTKTKATPVAASKTSSAMNNTPAFSVSKASSRAKLRQDHSSSSATFSCSFDSPQMEPQNNQQRQDATAKKGSLAERTNGLLHDSSSSDESSDDDSADATRQWKTTTRSKPPLPKRPQLKISSKRPPAAPRERGAAGARAKSKHGVSNNRKEMIEIDTRPSSLAPKRKRSPTRIKTKHDGGRKSNLPSLDFDDDMSSDESVLQKSSRRRPAESYQRKPLVVDLGDAPMGSDTERKKKRKSSFGVRKEAKRRQKALPPSVHDNELDSFALDNEEPEDDDISNTAGLSASCLKTKPTTKQKKKKKSKKKHKDGESEESEQPDPKESSSFFKPKSMEKANDHVYGTIDSSDENDQENRHNGKRRPVLAPVRKRPVVEARSVLDDPILSASQSTAERPPPSRIASLKKKPLQKLLGMGAKHKHRSSGVTSKHKPGGLMQLQMKKVPRSSCYDEDDF